MLNKLIKELKTLQDKEKAQILQRFFKTRKGEYGEGDVFLGITVPVLRKCAKEYSELSTEDIQKLLESKIHEHRQIALFIMSLKYKNKNSKEQKEIFNLYLNNTKNINNWDLVDLSAPNIIGEHLLDKDRKILYKMAHSKNLWEKRIAIISTFRFIRDNDLDDALRISEILLEDKHDLIHKAVGWMLREIGKRDLNQEEDFLKKHYKKMPRTMLRYAIEKFDDKKRKCYLLGNI